MEMQDTKEPAFQTYRTDKHMNSETVAADRGTVEVQAG